MAYADRGIEPPSVEREVCLRDRAEETLKELQRASDILSEIEDKLFGARPREASTGTVPQSSDVSQSLRRIVNQSEQLATRLQILHNGI